MSFTSSYLYNTGLLPDNTFSSTQEEREKIKLKRINAKRFSIKKIFASNIYIKQTNNLITITLFIFNKKNNIILNILKKLEFFSLPKKYLNNNNKKTKLNKKITSYKNNFLKNLSLSLLRKKRLYNLVKLYSLIRLLLYKDSLFSSSKKITGNSLAKKIFLHKLILNLINPYSYINSKKTKLLGSLPGLTSNLDGTNHSIRVKKGLLVRGKFIKKRFLKNLISGLYYNQMFLFNKLKLTSLFLNFKTFGLISFIEKIFNGNKVQLNIINLKSVYLNSDILSESIAKKLTDRKVKLLNIVGKALSKVKLPIFHSCLQDKPLNIGEHTKDNILKSIRYKTINGIRFEMSGRLTRRLTASRSIFKVRYIGNIKNIYSSYKHISSPILRGYIKSSLQYTLINSKTRNGSFGLKAWVNSY